MLPQYDERLGLTATLERSDDGVNELLLPYFGGICYRYGFEQAINDGVCAPPRVAFVGVDLSVDERAEYGATEQRLVSARHHLRLVSGMPLEPFGDFLAAVAHLAERDAGADGRAAREYLDAFSKRREIVAQSSGKYELLGKLAPAILEAHGALVFTETVRAANHAINRLDPLVSIDLITGSTARLQRREILDDLRVRKLDAVASPRVLDEGVDVPDANLGIVMSASRTRRQMIQRMGRILRRKRPGVAARFVIMFAKDTLEDPTNRIDRDGFLDEIERIAQATGVFDGAHLEALDAFLAAPGPEVVPEPEHLERYEHTAATVREKSQPAPDRVGETLADEMGVEVAYAFLAFAQGGRSDPRHEATLQLLDARLPQPDPDAPYLERALADLPQIAKPRVEPRRLSTGQAPLEIARIGSAWRISCTGCGEASEPVQFRWQVLDQTVRCRCD
jgi:superfamily II DNA or RNA helicase